MSWILITITAFIHGRLYRRTRIKSYLFFFLSWASFSAYVAGEFFSYLMLSELIFRLHYIALVFTGFFLILFIDFINQETAGNVKIAILCAISALVVFTSFQDGTVLDQVFPNGARSLQTVGFLRYFLIAFSLIFSSFYLYYMIVLNKHAPVSLKKYSRVALAGAFIFCVVTTVMYGSGLTGVIPGIHVLSEAVGGLITAWAFSKQPHLAYILPFKVMRLLVIDSRSGIDMFDHAWAREDEMVESSLVSGMIQGINSVLQESFQRGNCKEITMDQGIVMLSFAEDSPIIAALVTTRSSRSLRASLATFTAKFTKRYDETIKAGVYGKHQFDGVAEIVHECFPYIPRYT
ncbi:MAG: hypothetical protein Q6373_002710 [Candidatus Sigynarchaeota archaeon]